MRSFELAFPTRIVAGPGQLGRLGSEASGLGCKALLMTYSPDSGLGELTERARLQLGDSSVEPVLFDRVEPNPRHSTCDEGARIFEEQGCDLIVALGGGSVIDAAKAASAAAANGPSCWQYVRTRSGAKPISSAAPILAVPTTAATGSEANSEAVITNWETRAKCVIVGPALLAPRVAILDPELHLTVPAPTTADGVVDIVSHCLDPYLSGDEGSELQDELCEGVLNTTLKWGPIAYRDGADLQARMQLQLAATLAISPFTMAGRGGTWLMHNIEHALSAHYDIPHGRGMAVVMPRVMKLFSSLAPARLARLGRKCFGVPDGDPARAAQQTIEEFFKWLDSLDRNLTLGDLEIGPEKFEAMANDVIEYDGDGEHYHSVRKLDRDAIVDVLEDCLNPNS